MQKRQRATRQARAAALEAARELLSEWGRRGGKKRTLKLTAAGRKAFASAGAAARWKGISPAERSRILRKAALARWAAARQPKARQARPKKRQ